MSVLTVEQYEQAERQLSREEAGRGLLIHAAIIVVVSLALIAINLFLVPQFAWSPIAVAGMAIGVGLHYLFGVRWQERFLEAHQHQVEQRAERAGS